MVSYILKYPSLNDIMCHLNMYCKLDIICKIVQFRYFFPKDYFANRMCYLIIYDTELQTLDNNNVSTTKKFSWINILCFWGFSCVKYCRREHFPIYVNRYLQEWTGFNLYGMYTVSHKMMITHEPTVSYGCNIFL